MISQVRILPTCQHLSPTRCSKQRQNIRCMLPSVPNGKMLSSCIWLSMTHRLADFIPSVAVLLLLCTFIALFHIVIASCLLNILLQVFCFVMFFYTSLHFALQDHHWKFNFPYAFVIIKSGDGGDSRAQTCFRQRISWLPLGGGVRRKFHVSFLISFASLSSTLRCYLLVDAK